MTKQIFRDLLFKKDLNNCNKYLSDHLPGLDLVQIINDLIFVSASVSSDKKIHPICVINSIKNLISDDRDNPSIILLQFALEYLYDFNFRLNDKIILEETIKNGIGEIAFISDLEDACQINNWEEAQVLAAKVFLASDQSRAVMDSLVEIALQDVEKNALFTFHLLRAYQFQSLKEDNWVYTKCILDHLIGKPLPDPHQFKVMDLDKFKSDMIYQLDPTLFSPILRILDGEYVRSRGYERELSYWINSKNNGEYKLSTKIKIKNMDEISPSYYINIAESIIINSNLKNQIASSLVTLESLRYLTNKKNNETQSFLRERINKLVE